MVVIESLLYSIMRYSRSQIRLGMCGVLTVV